MTPVTPAADSHERELAHSHQTTEQHGAPDDGLPVLSVILNSPDNLLNQRRTLQHLRNQTIANQLEVILVSPSDTGLSEMQDILQAFHQYKIVFSPQGCHVQARQQAMGILAASAPYFAFGEDHCAPAPDWAEVLVEAFRRPEHYAGIGVAMHNANPQTALSWGNLLLAYLNWVAPVTAGEADWIPATNATYRRDVVMPFADRLERLLGRTSQLQPLLRSQGQRFYIEPRARVYHLNWSRWSATLIRRYAIGRYKAGSEVHYKKLSYPKRIIRLILAPLQPLVRFAKIHKRLIARGFPLQFKMTFGVAVALCGDVAGLIAGYLLGMGRAEEMVYRGEFNRDPLVRPEERGLNVIALHLPDEAARPGYHPVIP